jgi:hypothetical protein
MLGPCLRITCISATQCFGVVSLATWWGRYLAPWTCGSAQRAAHGGDNLRNYQDGAKRGFNVVSHIVKTGVLRGEQKYMLYQILRAPDERMTLPHRSHPHFLFDKSQQLRLPWSRPSPKGKGVNFKDQLLGASALLDGVPGEWI